MKIFVCLKQVPDTEAKFKISADGSAIDPTGIKWVMNPYDEFAVEEAIKLKEKLGATVQVFAVTLGPKARTADVLRTALAMGADEGILVDGPELLDALQTAKTLAHVIQAEGGADLILTGKLAIDLNQGAVPQMLATELGLPCAGVISKLEITKPDTQGLEMTLHRDVEGGGKEILQAKTPCVISANKGLNTPRYASLPGIMKAKKKTLKEYSFETIKGQTNLGEAGVIMNKITPPPGRPEAKIVKYEPGVEQQLVQFLKTEAKVL